MAMLVDKKHCSGCSACFAICPHGAISMQRDSEGFFYPWVDEIACINCSLCEKVCPSIHVSPSRKPHSVFAAKAKDDALRLESSSGGMFSLLAFNVLNRGGLVFGAAFDSSDWHVYHECIDNESDLDRLRGSKYVQSDMNDCFRSVKKAINDGREVLFSGTPCQIAGLRTYLSQACKSDMNKLLCVDVICHGVPSPLVWQKYLEKRVYEKYRAHPIAEVAIRRIISRNKYYGWKRHSMLLEFTNNMEYSAVFSKDSFMRGFLQELYNRTSCHDCRCKNLNSGSDITIGDYWGIESRFPKMDDDKGVSLVFINTIKGERAFNVLNDKIEKCESDFEHAINRNHAIIISTSPHKNRTKFFKLIKSNEDFDKLVDKMLRLSLRTRIKFFVKRCLRKIGFYR